MSASTAELKNVVVVGLGCGGIMAARGLASKLPPTHRLVAITEHAFGFWPIGALRGAVVPGWEDKVAVKLDAVFEGGSRHVVLEGTKVLSLNSHSIVVDAAHGEFGTEISFEYAVIATGSTYAFPCRPAEGDKTVEDVRKTLLAFQADVASSSAILVVGGGPTGVEFAAEVAQLYGSDKPVTLVHSEEQYFATGGLNKRVGKKVQSQLDALGVVSIFGAKAIVGAGEGRLKTGKITKQAVKLSNGSAVDADFIMLAYGCSPNSKAAATLSADLLNTTGFIKVKPSLQLLSDGGKFDHIYAIGDVNDVAETKLAFHAGKQAEVVIANVLAAIAGTPVKGTYTAAARVLSVTVGSSAGAGQLFGMVLWSWFVTMMKSKSLMIHNFRANYGLKA